MNHPIITAQLGGARQSQIQALSTLPPSLTSGMKTLIDAQLGNLAQGLGGFDPVDAYADLTRTTIENTVEFNRALTDYWSKGGPFTGQVLAPTFKVSKYVMPWMPQF